MSVRADLRRAERSLNDAPVQTVLACLGILGRHPRNARARQLLSGMTAAQRATVLDEAGGLMDAGHWSEALALLTPLGRAHPSDVALAQAETRCLLNIGCVADVLPRLDAPLRAAPGHPALLATLGTALFRLGDSAKALPLLEQAATGRPDDPHIANHLGLAQRAHGQLDAAKDCFRTASLAGLPEAWANLAPMIDFTAEPALAEALDAGLARSDLTALQTELLAFARAKAAFDWDNIEDAFVWLNKANALHRTEHPYDPAGSRARVTALAQRLPPAAEIELAPRVILVTGMPRSGTTLVERILDAHPQVEGLGECPDLTEAVAAIDRGFVWSPCDRDALANRYCAALRARQKTSAGIVVDKMPSNALAAGFALAALPNAHVVHIRRDPIATGLSIFRTRFTDSNEFAYDLGDIADRHALTERCTAHWAKAFPSRVYQMTLEALTAAPELEIAALLESLQLPPDPACLRFSGASGDVRTASAHQVRGPVAPQPSASWQRYAAHLKPLIEALARFDTAEVSDPYAEQNRT